MFYSTSDRNLIFVIPKYSISEEINSSNGFTSKLYYFNVCRKEYIDTISIVIRFIRTMKTFKCPSKIDPVFQRDLADLRLRHALQGRCRRCRRSKRGSCTASGGGRRTAPRRGDCGPAPTCGCPPPSCPPPPATFAATSRYSSR